MTREEMKELKGLAASMGLYDDKNPCKRAVILGKAIKALEQEPCKDAISRQAVLDKKKLVELEDGQSFYCISPEDVETLQPVTPQPKSGEWIVHEKPYGIRYLECPYCNIWYLNEHLIRNSFCPNCGAKMIVLQERSGEE